MTAAAGTVTLMANLTSRGVEPDQVSAKAY